MYSLAASALSVSVSLSPWFAFGNLRGVVIYARRTGAGIRHAVEPTGHRYLARDVTFCIYTLPALSVLEAHHRLLELYMLVHSSKGLLAVGEGRGWEEGLRSGHVVR